MKKSRDGSAMIVVLCVMAVTVTLSLALLLTSSVMMRNAARSSQKEQCRINAVSLSEVLKKEILSYQYEGFPVSDGEDRETSLKGKLQSVWTNAWYAYEADAGSLEQLAKKGKDYYTYDLGDCGLPGESVLELYWIDEMEDSMKEPDRNEPEEAARMFSNLFLYVKVTSTVGQESSTIISRYYPVAETKKELVTGEDGQTTERTVWGTWSWVYDEREWERSDSR